MREQKDELPSSHLTLVQRGEQFVLDWVRPGANTFSMRKLSETIWVTLRLDGWQEWGDHVLVPSHSVRMGAEWAPPLACIVCSAAEIRALASLPPREAASISCATFRYLDNTISTSQVVYSSGLWEHEKFAR